MSAVARFGEARNTSKEGTLVGPLGFEPRTGVQDA